MFTPCFYPEAEKKKTPGNKERFVATTFWFVHTRQNAVPR